LIWKGQSLRYDALVDSGADFCIFDAEIAEYLGIEVKSGKPLVFGGIQEVGSKAATAYMHQIQLTIGGHTFTTSIGFSYDIAKQGFGVLGQKGFFDHFKVGFNLAKEKIELKPVE
jgi:predicted aspartyl protease